MLVELASLKPNPMRDFVVDPLDDDRIADLLSSIEDDGFWGGIVCRQADNGDIQIGAGHHRVAAALKAGVKRADVFVGDGDMNDATMIRIYGRENSTQRGNSGAAQAGTVAAVLRLVAKAILGGSVSEEFFGNQDIGKIRGNLLSDKGIGRDVVVNFLDGIPGFNDGTVQQALVNLKAGGHYARIISEVRDEIERENREAQKALEKAERDQKRLEKEREEAEERQKQAEAARREAAAKAKAAKEEADKKRAEEVVQRAELERQRAEEQSKLAEKRRAESEEQLKKFAAMKTTTGVAAATAAKAKEAADKRPITFDFEGVARHLKNAHQIDAFRKCVTGDGIAPYLAVNKQADLARHLVELAMKRGDKELSAAFIRENVTALVLDVRNGQRRIDKEDQEAVLMNDLRMRLHQHQRDFSRCCRGLASYGTKIKEMLEKEWPSGQAVPISNELRTSLASAKLVIDSLIKRI